MLFIEEQLFGLRIKLRSCWAPQSDNRHDLDTVMVASTLRMCVKGVEADDSPCKTADTVKKDWPFSFPSVFRLKVGRKQAALLLATEVLRKNIFYLGIYILV